MKGRGRGYGEQAFLLKMCEKYLEKESESFVAFVNLKKGYDEVNIEALPKVL